MDKAPLPQSEPEQPAPENRPTPTVVAQAPLSEEEVSVLRRRAWAGVSLGLLGIMAVEEVARRSLHHLHQPVGDIRSRDVAIVHIAQLIAQALVAMAVVFFAYQLLRAAERLLLPYWLLKRDHVDLLKMMLGVETPVDGATKLVEEVRRTVEASKSDEK